MRLVTQKSTIFLAQPLRCNRQPRRTCITALAVQGKLKVAVFSAAKYVLAFMEGPNGMSSTFDVQYIEVQS